MILRNRDALNALMRGRYTTVTLAAEVGVTKQLIAYLCSGRRISCSRPTAEGIENALGCVAGTLFSPRTEEDSSNGEEEEVLLTIPKAAKALGVSKTHAYRLVADGDLPVVYVGRRGSKKPMARVKTTAIDEFIKSREAAAAR
ncbi:helix-turn-helix domain-containing protein [Nonomuraea sp. NPDC004580]|uniref:helix-turn-helix transcriptional regulator n=1 Tax=Nonomuraea sp. NPDC004580 TaxID=3154552 RepID=UPI0033BBEFD0